MKCKRPLDYQSLSEGPDNDVYCKNCYSYTHGHKSKANLHDADCTQLQGEEGDADVCPRCTGRVFEAEKQIAKPGSYHRRCFTCVECKHQMDPTNFANGPDNEIYCVHCYELIHGKKAKTKSMPLDTTSIMGEAELGTCPRCSGKVFSAEKMVAASGHYHRYCCRRAAPPEYFVLITLTGTASAAGLARSPSTPLGMHPPLLQLLHFLPFLPSVCDGPDNKIFCRVCYRRQRGR